MIPQRALPDLLSAERGLARLDTSLADSSRARRYACDAARRSALAMAALDGALVAMDDLLLALVAPDEVDLPRRQGASRAAAIYRLLVALRDGLGPSLAVSEEVPKDGRLRPETVAAWSLLTAETRRLLAEAEAALAADEEDAGDPSSDRTAPLPPWTLAWVEDIHARWHEACHGRRSVPWTLPVKDVGRNALRLIDEALGADPGVAGAARALHRLHTMVPELPGTPLPILADEDEQSRSIRRYIANQAETGWWAQFARLVAPQLLARACRLDRAWLPVGAVWGRDHAGYRIALGGGEDDWVVWMARLLADAAEAESARSEAIEARQEGWIAATAVVPRLPRRRSDTLGPTRRQRAGTRRSTSRLPRLLDLLWEQPVVSARAVERRLGMTYRSALDLIQDLEAAGVLRRATDRKLDRLWRAATV